jgi:Nuclease A inhibitor-like protein
MTAAENLDSPTAQPPVLRVAEICDAPLERLCQRLRQATADLLWMSESDYPFEVVTWERGIELNPQTLFPEVESDEVSVETVTLTDFFAPAIAIEDWYEAEELAQVDRYKELLHAIESNLTAVQVFRVGEVEITIYIVGKTIDGDLVGLKTQTVET